MLLNPIIIRRSHSFHISHLCRAEETAPPADPTPAEIPVEEPVGPPPTMTSGYSGLTEADWKKPPAQILKEHDETVRTFANALSQKTLTHHLKLACRHENYAKFISLLPGRMFGSKGVEDFVEFEVWLKKLEILNKQEQMRASKAVTPPTASTTPSPKPTLQKNATLGVGGDETMTPEERKAYKNYWKKFEKPSTPTASPAPSVRESVSGSPGPSSVITPEVKKRLDLEGLVGGGVIT